MRRVFAFAGRAILIGLVFAIARLIAALVASSAGDRDVVGVFAVEFVAGCGVGVWSEYVVLHVAGRDLRVASALAIALAIAVFVNLLAVMVEGATFEPDAQPVSTLTANAALQLIVAVLVGLTTTALVPRSGSAASARAFPRRPVLAWLARYVACVATYVVLYFIVGAINFALVTGPYYDSGVAGLVVPPAGVVFAVAVVEGSLFPAALLPLFGFLPGTRRARMLIGGMSLFVLGGVVPLIVAPSLPPALRLASAVEILLQKFPAGAAAAALLGPEDVAPRGSEVLVRAYR